MASALTSADDNHADWIHTAVRDVFTIYAHNDEMAIGAIQALELAGRKPGEDVLVVSIDGTRDALQAIIDGKLVISVVAPLTMRDGQIISDVRKTKPATEPGPAIAAALDSLEPEPIASIAALVGS
mgnify:CR=1 FL=1